MKKKEYVPFYKPDLDWIGCRVVLKTLNDESTVITGFLQEPEDDEVCVCFAPVYIDGINQYPRMTLDECFNKLDWSNYIDSDYNFGRAPFGEEF